MEALEIRSLPDCSEAREKPKSLLSDLSFCQGVRQRFVRPLETETY